MEYYITLVLNILLIAFIGFGMLWGLIRGLRKTACRGIFLIVISVILLFVTMPITQALLNIEIETSITIGENTTTGMMSIQSLIEFFIKDLIGEEFCTQNPEFVNVIIALPIIFVNAILYVILFWLAKILLYPLNYLLYKFTFAPKHSKLSFSSFNDNEEHFDFNLHQETQTLKNTSAKDQMKLADNSNEQNNFQSSEQSHEQNSIESSEPNKNTNEPFVIITDEKESVNFKKLKRKEKHKKEKIKYKKHRLLGALVGAGVGFVVMLNTMLPVYGFMSILENSNTLRLTNVSDDDITLSNTTNGLTDQILNAYNDSYLYKVSKYSGIMGLGIAEFDYITSRSINNKTITLREDVDSIIKTVNDVDLLIGKYNSFTTEGNISELTEDQISILLTDTKNLLAKIKNINLIDAVSDYLVPVACSLVLKTDVKISDNEIMNELIKDALKSLNNSSGINVIDELNTIVDLAEYLNNQGLLTRILKNTFDDPITIIKNLDSDFSDQLTTKLFNLKIVETTIPYVVNLGLQFLDDAIDYGYDKNTAEANVIKNGVSSLLNNIFKTARTLDKDAQILLSFDSLIPLGQTLNVAKNSGLLTETTYKNLINYATDNITELVSSLMPEEFKGYIEDELLKNIAKVDNWEVEMTTIHHALVKLRNKEIGILGSIVEGKELRQGTNIELNVTTSVLENIGVSLDILESTCLFGARTFIDSDTPDQPYQVSGIISFLLSGMDYTTNKINDSKDIDSDIKQIVDVLEDMRQNLIKSNHTYDQENKFWENELKLVAPLIETVYKMIDTNNFEIKTELGQNLDIAKSSVMLNGATTAKLVESSLDIVKSKILGDDYTYNNGSNSSTPQTLNDKIYELFLGIKKNLQTTSVKNQIINDKHFWTTEIEYYKTLNNIANKVGDITDIASAEIMASDLDVIYSGNSRTIPRKEINNILAFVIRDLQDNTVTSTDYIQISINQALNNIASRLEDEEFLDGKDLTDFWKIELGHLKRINDIKFEDSAGYNVIDNLPAIGKELDKTLEGYTENSKNIRASYLLEYTDLRNILSSAVKEMKSTITSTFDDEGIKPIIETAIDSISSNISITTTVNPINFEFELGKLKLLSKLSISSELLSYPTGTADEIQTKLNENKLKLETLGTELDAIAYHYNYSSTNNKYQYLEAYNSKIVTRNIINKIIMDMFDISKFTSTEISAETDENKQTIMTAFNTLISSIVTEINNYNNIDAIISWTKELGYVNNLIALNKDVNFTIDNISTEIGKNIDEIAFNYTENTEFKFNDIEFDTNNECVIIPENNANSLFVKRPALISALNSILATAKSEVDPSDSELDQEKTSITNSIIDNSLATIATNNTQLNSSSYYKNCFASFEDLNSIDDAITQATDNVSGDITDLKDSDIPATLDTLLASLQERPATGILITRRIALLIIKHITIPSELQTTITYTYYNKIKTHLENNITSNLTTPENYATNDTLNYNDTSIPTYYYNLLKTLVASLPTA